MSTTWESIRAIKNKTNSLREKLQKRRKDRQDPLNLSSGVDSSVTEGSWCYVSRNDELAEHMLLCHLSNIKLSLPVTSQHLFFVLETQENPCFSHPLVCNLLRKFSLQKLIRVTESTKEGESIIEVLSIEESKIADVVNELLSKQSSSVTGIVSPKVNLEEHENATINTEENESDAPIPKRLKDDQDQNVNDVLSLIKLPSIREKELKKIGEEILDLLSKPTTKERLLMEKFRSPGTQLTEFCVHRTRDECALLGSTGCKKLHFKKIIESHTDESLGDCSYLNTCFHIQTCKYVHYEVDRSGVDTIELTNAKSTVFCTEKPILESTILYPPQWIQCDLRYFDTTILGKFAVIMADPPWDIHMELPYGTLSDDEMRCLGVPNLQDEGLLFLWVTGRAMELGRECLSLWGYEYVDELVWVKTNQLQRIIRTGRTGHWLNHGKEHCLVGMKGNPKNLNRGLDCDVIVAEVRDTSHKPDEIYGIIERLSPTTRKIELFGRSHNVQPNWITLGNQVQGVHLVDPDIILSFQKRYPNGNCMTPSQFKIQDVEISR